MQRSRGLDEGMWGPSNVAHIVNAAVLAVQSEKSAAQVAREIGYSRPNIVSMFRTGRTRVPFDRARALAKSLNIDLAFLVNAMLEEYHSELYSMLCELKGELLSANEKEVIELWRNVTNGGDPSVKPFRKLFDGVRYQLAARKASSA